MSQKHLKGLLSNTYVRVVILILLISIVAIQITKQSGKESLPSDDPWSSNCLKDCTTKQVDSVTSQLYKVRDCAILKDMYDITPGNTDQATWVRLVSSRARVLNCENI
jgi:hypothetical protein